MYRTSQSTPPPPPPGDSSSSEVSSASLFKTSVDPDQTAPLAKKGLYAEISHWRIKHLHAADAFNFVADVEFILSEAVLLFSLQVNLT